MPRHDRAYGHYHQSGRKAGNKRRTRQRGKNTYAAKASRTATRPARNAA